MTTSTQSVAAPSNKARWAGRILSGLAIAFLVVDSVMKLVKTAPAVKGTAELGYRPACSYRSASSCCAASCFTRCQRPPS